MGSKVRVGIIGCGVISGVYLEAGQKFDILDVAACADLDMGRAQARAAQYGVEAQSVEELLADPSIEIVVNLTIPAAHAAVTEAILMSGKHVYSEKPLALTREEGQRILALAQERGLRVGCAPDTVLGAGIQTCRKLIDDGVIGEPVAATAFMLSHGPESWHPNPEFFYQPGAGPLFDMGPYYLTALATLVGPVRRVAASARRTFEERVIGSQPLAGTRIQVNTPTHVASVLDFASGAVGTLVTTFDVWPTDLPRIEIYGVEGSLGVPDPNTFGGPVRLRRANTRDWVDVPLTHGHAVNSRGIGVADMAHALATGRAHRASGELAYHVLDIMHALLESSAEGRHIELSSGVDRPQAVRSEPARSVLSE